MTHILEDLKAFLDTSPTSWHAASEMANRLAGLDFIPLDEKEKWSLEAGKSYFVTRGGSLCAFSLPESAPEKMILIAAHTDSPTLKIKPRPEIQKENMTLFGIEVYGSPLLTSWLNRDLSVAGRIVVTDIKNQVEEKLVHLDDTPLFIPQIAPHLDREINEKGILLNKQEHLCPLVCLGNDSSNYRGFLESLLRRQLTFNSLLGFDLFLVPLEASRFLGSHNEMLASYRIDNLASSHACVTALAKAKRGLKNQLQMAIFWDHEEIGSRTAEGAASPFFSDIMKRIAQKFQLNEEDLIRMKNRSLCISVDMAHALNPNYPAKHDVNHQPLLGKGIVIKYNADQRYASNALTASSVIHLCQQNHIDYQLFVSRGDIPSGTTIGPIFAAATGIPTVDIGCPQLSMHAAREVMACQDHVDMCALLTHLLQTE